MHSNSPPKKSGFTLIELLVVITIIAILATVGLLYYSNFQKSARDARRQSDLKLIQSALEQYYADALAYPAQSNFVSPLSYNGKTYLNTIPNDPKGSPDYSYVQLPSGCSGSQCTYYCLYARLEGLNKPSTDPACINNYPTTDYNYGVTRP